MMSLTQISSLDQDLRLDRSLLKDQATDVMRDLIVKGKIAPGARLVEREIAEMLGTSRMPIHIALVQLEKEGLVVNRPEGHFVIELSERDVRELYKVRLILERGAAELAAQNTNSTNAQKLRALQDALHQAVASKDFRAYVALDVEMHRTIWQQADNRHLLKALNAMIGPIFMFIANNADRFNWDETLALHEDLVQCINSGDVECTGQSITRHLENALQRSVQIFHRES